MEQQKGKLMIMQDNSPVKMFQGKVRQIMRCGRKQLGGGQLGHLRRAGQEGTGGKDNVP